MTTFIAIHVSIRHDVHVILSNLCAKVSEITKIFFTLPRSKRKYILGLSIGESL